MAILSSCSNDDDCSISNELSGVWNLISVSCECEPGDFETGEHVWNFDVTNNEINVINNPDEDLQILDTGSYAFTLTNNTITILSVVYDYYFENENLILANNPEADGPLMEFIRN